MPPSLDRIVIKVHQPDMIEKFFFFVSGILISVPFTIFFESFADSLAPMTSQFFASFWATVIVAPLVEEFAKAYPLFYRHGETKKSIYTLGFLVGLGFGISEFFIYVLVYGAPIALRLPGILFHAASTSIVAYGIATKRPKFFYAIAVLLHFINNFSAMFDVFWLIGGVTAITATYFMSLYFYNRLSENDNFVQN